MKLNDFCIMVKYPNESFNQMNRCYMKPFFGSGTLFFRLKPNIAAINYISSSLIEY